MRGKRTKRVFYAMLFLTICLSGLLGRGDRVLAAYTKGGVEYPSKVRMDVGTIMTVDLMGKYGSGHSEDIKYIVVKVTTNSKRLKAYNDPLPKGYQMYHSIRMYGEKKGTYKLTVSIKHKETGKKETIRIPVYVGDRIVPIQGIKIGGKKLVKLQDLVADRDRQYYYSEKSSGKIQVTMDPRCKITRIEAHGRDNWNSSPDPGFRTPEYNQGGWEETLENGGEIVLNDRAAGEGVEDKSVHTYSDVSSYFSAEIFDFPLARTAIDIYYMEEHSDREYYVGISVFTKVKPW